MSETTQQSASERVRDFCIGWARDNGERYPVVLTGHHHAALALADLQAVVEENAALRALAVALATKEQA